MNIFTILEGLVLLGVAAITVVLVIAVLLGARKRSGRRTLLYLGLCMLPLGCSILFYGWVFGPADYRSAKDLAAAYRAEFGEFPPDDVTDIEARQVVVGDSGAAWLRFHASSKTIDRLLGRFVPSGRDSFNEAGRGANVPKWWTPDQSKVELFYTADHWSKYWSNSRAFIGVDQSKSMVFFHHIGFD